MKGLSIEEKAKAYDEIIKKANKMHHENCEDCQACIEELIPELAETEDERIRKLIIKHFKEIANSNEQSWISLDIPYILAWLEKQGEHANFRNKIQIGDKVTRNEDGVLVNLSQLKRVAKKDEKQGEQKPLGFNIGDEITVNGQICKVVAVEQKPTYTKEYDFHGMKFIPKFAKGDIIKEKKRGEVSTIEDFSYDTGLYTHTYGQFPITIQDNYEIIEQKPADKVERKGMNLVEEEMTPFQKNVFCIIDLTIEKELGLKQVCDELLALASNEIKQKSAEWTEDDEHRLKDTIYFLDTAKKHYASTFGLDTCIDWLKSLRPHSQWKPSDEQMKALDDVINSRDIRYDVLSELWKDLNKLK